MVPTNKQITETVQNAVHQMRAMFIGGLMLNGIVITSLKRKKPTKLNS